MVDDVAVGSFALLLGPCELGGAHLQNRFDGGPAHDVDEVIDGALGLLDKVEHGEQQLAVLGEEGCELFGVREGVVGVVGNDLVALVHRWWFLFWRTEISRMISSRFDDVFGHYTSELN
mgnify:CR=1 FL=1